MANTLNLGNGNWATKENSLLGYNSENGNFKPLAFDFTRASNGTFVNKAGLIETVQSGVPRIDFSDSTSGALLLEPQRSNLINYSSDYTNPYWTKSGATIQADATTAGSELVTNGDFATDTDWTKETGWTISGGTANSDGTSSASALYQNLSLTTGSLYKLSFKVTNYVSGSFKVYLSDGQQIGATDLITSNGNYTFYIAALGALCLFRNVTNFIGSIDNVSVKEVQGFASPDGTNNAFKLVEDSNNSTHRVYRPSNIPSGTSTISVYAKKSERNYVVLSNSSDGTTVYYNLSTGVIDAQSVGWDYSNIDELGNGWYRCSATLTVSSSKTLSIYIAETSSSVSYQGDGTSGLYIYGAQVEQGSYSTSLINTQGSAVTRVQDVCKIVDSPILQATNQFTLFFDAKDFVNYGATFANIMITLGAGESPYDAGSGIHIYNKIWYYFNGSSAVTLGNCYNATTDSKFAISYDGTKYTRYANGIKLGTNTTSASMSNWDTLTNGSLSYSGVDRIFNIADLKLYNTALSDSEAIALTQV